MDEPKIDRRKAPFKLFVAGIVLSAVSCGLIVLFAPNSSNVGPALLFLVLCVPQPVATMTAFGRTHRTRWQLDGVNAMAKIGPFELWGHSEDGEPEYNAFADVMGNGLKVKLPARTYSDREWELLKFSDTVPIAYLRNDKIAKVRFELLELVDECVDPLAPQQTEHALPSVASRWPVVLG